MTKHNCLTPSSRECGAGALYTLFSMTLLPRILTLVPGFSATTLNFAYFLLNFGVLTWIFRQFLLESLGRLRGSLLYLCYTALCGAAGIQVLTSLVTVLLFSVFPGYFNANDASVGALVQESPGLMILGTVILAPVGEELMYRAAIFGGLYPRSTFWAYFVSVVLFSIIHILNYLTLLPPLHLLLSFLQYLPASFCLALVYHRSGSIFAPMLVHILINFLGIVSVR